MWYILISATGFLELSIFNLCQAYKKKALTLEKLEIRFNIFNNGAYGPWPDHNRRYCSLSADYKERVPFLIPRFKRKSNG